MMMDDVFIKLTLTTVYGKLLGEPSAPLILAIHGWSQSNGWHTWEPMMAPLADAGYCVVSVDMPGWGDSPPMDALPLGGERAAEVIIDIMNGLQKTSAVLMGKSWGGGVAINTALLYPERISRLILTAPAYRQPEKLCELTQPTLLAWAEDDPVIPYSRSGQITEAIPEAHLESYATGGHSAAQNNVADFAPKAIAFLSN